MMPADFPLRVEGGVNIYGQTQSSPLLVAASPEIANRACMLMNEMWQVSLSLVQDGCWAGPDGRGLMNAAVL